MFLPQRVPTIQQDVIRTVAAARGQDYNDPRVAYDIEKVMQLDPVGELKRLFPVHVIGASISANVATFKPQRRCIPIRLCIPKAQGVAGGIVQNLTAALIPLYTTSVAEPSANFAETESEISWLAPVVVNVGQFVTFQTNSNVTSAGLWVAEIDLPPIGAPDSFLARAPFTTGTLTHQQTTTFTVAPQKKMRLRRLAFDVQGNTNATKVSACNITAINCGVEPQLMSADPVPLPMFDSQVIFGYMDGDVVSPGQTFSISITNPDAAVDLTVGGVILGDILPE